MSKAVKREGKFFCGKYMNNNEIDRDILNKYARCMEEIKRRKQAIISIIARTSTTLYPITNIEFCALQLRKILELIVLANLVANRDEYSKVRNSFEKDWNISGIIKTLKDKVNNKFYPEPIIRVNQKYDSDGRCYTCEWKHKTDNFLTQEKLQEIYNYTSTFIHSKNPFNTEKEEDLKKIEGLFITTCNLITGLLNEHNCYLCNGNLINCTMSAIDPKDKNSQPKVSVWYFGKISEEEAKKSLTFNFYVYARGFFNRQSCEKGWEVFGGGS